MFSNTVNARTTNHLRAFSVAELLVVIAVIAILAAILLPAIARSRGSGRQIDCLGHEKQIMLAALLYADDNNEKMSGERMS